MKTKHNKARRAVSLILALLLLLSIFSCSAPSSAVMDSKEEITAKMNEDLAAPDRLQYTHFIFASSYPQKPQRAR